MRRHKRVRAVVKGTSERPRLSVFRSASHIYAQLIDDAKGVTLFSASDAKGVRVKPSSRGRVEGKVKDKKITVAFTVGETLAKKALEKGIDKVVFDRGGYKYHGRVKALADGARAGGLNF
ncbi:MAG: 50S ribosomal protein L18 [Parcubacteria group bacterium Gr01-1014_2]|nr:MAG: 50S ribosomal protein L18 [Parcubacteria group bacterium Gr01-1014_2]